MKKNLVVIIVIGCVWLGSACTNAPAPTGQPADVPVPTAPPPVKDNQVPPQQNLTDGCVESYAEGVDYFPEKSTVTQGAGFQIEYFLNYKVITVIEPFPGAAVEETYVLVQCGTPHPEGFSENQMIEVPIKRLVTMSTTYLPFLEELGLLDRLVGVDAFAFVYSEAVREMIAAGELAEVGGGAEVNIETVLDLEPDLVMTYASGSPDYDAHPKLEEVGIPVALNADYLGVTPLSRTEWVKFIGAFFNVDGAADDWFAEVVNNYERLAAIAETADERPTVLPNTPFEGTWYLPGGNSYFAVLLEDAGADYLWAEDESTSTLFLDFETVYDRAAEADYWINIGFFGSLEDLLAADERFDEFTAFQNGKVYNPDKRQNEFGGNDFYEGGIAQPDVILADLIKIFHPDLLAEHELTYYRIME